jgi:phage/plasmid-like protein (TIGR03299 family)
LGAEEVIGLATGHTGIVADKYQPFQNEALVDYLHTLTDESGACLDTAGSMRGGADVVVTMKLPTTMLVGGIDELDVNIAFLNNHTGNRAITGLITPTRIVCANTQRAALANARSSFKIRHTANAGDRVQQAREQLGLTWKYVAEFQTQAERMINESLEEVEFRKVCDQILAIAHRHGDRPQQDHRGQPQQHAQQGVHRRGDQFQHPRHTLGRLPGDRRVPRPRRFGARQDARRQGDRPRSTRDRRHRRGHQGGGVRAPVR